MPVVAPKDSSNLAPLLAEDTHVKNTVISTSSEIPNCTYYRGIATYGPKPPSIVTVFKREACILVLIDDPELS